MNTIDSVNPFTIIYNQWLLSVKPYQHSGSVAFKISFPGEILLDIYPVIAENNISNWKTIGEGNQQTTNEIGKLIEQYLKSKKKYAIKPVDLKSLKNLNSVFSQLSLYLSNKKLSCSATTTY